MNECASKEPLNWKEIFFEKKIIPSTTFWVQGTNTVYFSKFIILYPVSWFDTFCIRFGIPSAHFGQVDRVASGLRIDKGHSSCRALLADHKALLVDPEYFTKSCGIPYTTVSDTNLIKSLVACATL